MKKLLFVLAFTFIGQQAFSQMYIVTYHEITSGTGVNCDHVLTKTDPSGNQTFTCIDRYIGDQAQSLSILNQELNSIISQGYKLIETNTGSHTGLINNSSYLNLGTTWYFAIP
jgi:hypothetical protein